MPSEERRNRLEACLPGAIRISPGGDLYYHIQRRLTDHAPWADRLGTDLRRALEGDSLRTYLHCAKGFLPETALILDLETTGLSGGEPLFLIGLLRMGADGVVMCHQLLARDGAEEAGVVSAFAGMLREAQLLVTFNGRRFDVPVLRARAVACRIELPPFPPHLDVLVEARRCFRHRVPNCRLQTLEERLCGRTRMGDIPGAQIPRVYWEFVRTGDAARLAVIAQHNLLDLATTAELLTRLWG